MKPEIKRALETIREECRKHDTCNIRCPFFNPSYKFCNGEIPCLIHERTPDEYNIDEWEKENKI